MYIPNFSWISHFLTPGWKTKTSWEAKSRQNDSRKYIFRLENNKKYDFSKISTTVRFSPKIKVCRNECLKLQGNKCFLSENCQESRIRGHLGAIRSENTISCRDTLFRYLILSKTIIVGWYFYCFFNLHGHK